MTPRLFKTNDDEPEQPQPFEPLPVPQRRQQEDDLGLLGMAGDMVAAPFRGVEAFGQSIYQLGDTAFGDALPDWNNRFLGDSKTIGGGLVEGITEFMVGFIPVVGWVGKGAKVGRSLQLAKGLSKGAEQTAKAAGKAKKAIGIRMARDAAAGIPVDMALYGGSEERLSNIIQEASVLGIDLENPITAFLAADGDDSEIVGRIKTAIEGVGLGFLADGLITGLTYKRTANRILRENPGASADELEAKFEEAHPAGDIEGSMAYDPLPEPGEDFVGKWKESERYSPVDQYDPTDPVGLRGQTFDANHPRTDTNTAEFRDWFQKSVASEGDQPTRVYHYGEFDPDSDPVPWTKKGMHFGTKKAAEERAVGRPVDQTIEDSTIYKETNDEGEEAWYWDTHDGIGSWDTNPNGFGSEQAARQDLEAEAIARAKGAFESADEIGQTNEFYLSIQNPMRVADQGQDWTRAIARAKELGHDGLVYTNKYEDKGKDSYVIFSPEQAKLTDNQGTWSANSGNVFEYDPVTKEMTPEFRSFFGDSEVVDDGGKPLEVAHSTNAEDFTEFRTQGLSAHFGDAGAAADREKQLRDFSENVVGRDPGTFRTERVYLRIENPLEMPDMADTYRMQERGEIISRSEVEEWTETGDLAHPMSWDGEGDVQEYLYDQGILDREEFFEVQYDLDALQNLLKEKGYDGIKYENAVENPGSTSWIPFDPEQIKRVDNLRPDKNSPHIDQLNPDQTKATLKPFGYGTDNPGGYWLEEKREWALADPERMGALTATADRIPIAVEDLKKIEGEAGEHTRMGDPYSQEKISKLRDSIKAEGYHENNGPLLWVRADGRVTVAEGNHRIRAAEAAGLDTIPVQVRWFAGAEDVAGDFSAESLARRVAGDAQYAPTDHASLTDALRSAPDMADAAPEVVDFIERIGPRMFDGVGLRIAESGPMGQMDYANGLITISRKAIETGNFKWTMLHEMWHHLSRFVPDDMRQALEADYQKDLARATQGNPRLAEALANGDQLGSRDYRFKSFDEWFAETMTERTGPKMQQLDAASQSVFAHMRLILAELWESMRAKFGHGAADAALTDFMRGRLDVQVRDYGLDGGRKAKLNPKKAKTSADRARFLQRIGMTPEKAGEIAKQVDERVQDGLPADINPRAKTKQGHYLHSKEELLAMRLQANRRDLNLLRFEGSAGALHTIRQFEETFESVISDTKPMRRRSLNEAETEAMREAAKLVGLTEGGLMGQVARSIGKEVVNIRAINNRVQAYKSLMVTSAEQLHDQAQLVLDATRATDADLLEFAENNAAFSEIVAGVKGLLAEQGRGLQANRGRVRAADLENIVKTAPDKGGLVAPGKGPGLGPGKGPGKGPGLGAGKGPGLGPGQGPGKGPGLGPGKGPGLGPGKGPGKGPGLGPGKGPGDGPTTRPSSIEEGLEKHGGRERIRKLAQQIADAYGDGSLDGIRAVRELVEPTRWDKFWGIINEYFLNSILSGLHTLAINPISAGMMAVYIPMEKMMGSGFSIVARGAAGENISPHLAEMARAYRELSSLAQQTTAAFVDSMKLGIKAGKQQQNILDAKHAIDDISQYRGMDAKRLGIQEDSVMGHSVNWLGHAIRVPSSILTGTDEFVKQIVARSKMRADLLSTALEQNMTPGQARKWADDKLQTLIKDGQAYSGKRIYDEGVAEAQARGITDPMELEEAGLQYLKDNFDPSMQSLATAGIERAQDSTFTASLDKNRLPAKVQRMVIEHPYLRLFLPFVRTPTNIVDSAIQRLTAPVLVPIAHIKSVRGKEAMRRIKESGGRLAKDVASGDPQKQAEAYGRAMTGVGMLMTFGGLTASGAITGRGPSDPEQRRLLLATGWQPYSFKTAEGYIEYARMEPFATMLGTMADFTEYAKWMPVDEQETVETMAYAMMTALANNFTNKTYLTGVKALVEAASQPDRKMESLGKRYAATLVPNFFSQSVVNPQDDHMKDVRDLLDAVIARVPGLSDSVEPLRNILGEPIEAKKSVFAHESDVAGFQITDAFLPLAYRATRSDIIATELRDLQYGFTPPKTTARGADLLEFTKGGQTAYDRYAELHGKVKVSGMTMRAALQKIIKSKAYQSLPLESTTEVESPRIQIIRRVVGRFRRAAFRQLLDEYPEIGQEIGRLDALQTLALAGQS